MSVRMLAICALLSIVVVRAQSTDPPLLEAAKPIERQIADGAIHTYRLRLDAGEYFFVTARQRGIDVQLSLDSPGGARLIDMKRFSAPADEDLFWIASEPGEYRIVIEGDKQKTPGTYTLELRTLHAATTAERSALAALRKTWFEAEPLRVQNTAASMRQALAKYEEAIALWKAAGDGPWEGWILKQMSDIYDRLGDLPRSRDALVTALPLIHVSRNPLMESIILNSLGVALLRLGDTRPALDYFEQALALRSQLGYRRGEAITLNNMANAYDHLGETTQAIDTFLRSLAIRREVGDRAGEATTLDNLSAIYRRVGQSDKALETAVAALALRRTAGDRRGEASTLNSIASAYATMGDFEKAQDYWKQSQSIYERLGDAIGVGAAIGNLATASAMLKKYDEAAAYLERSIELRRAASNRDGEATSMVKLCGVLVDAGNSDKALQNGERALTISREIEFQDGVGLSHACLGRAYGRLGNWAQARENLQKSIELNRASGNMVRLGESLALVAEVERDAGNYAEALARSEEALAIAEAERLTVQDPDLRASYRAYHSSQYAMKVDVLMRMHSAKPSAGFAARAFEANERSRALSLIEMVADSGADFREELTEDQRHREDAILVRISSAQRELLRSQTTSTRKGELEQQRTAAERDLELYRVQLRAAGSRYAIVQYEPIAETQRIRNEVLRSDAALVEFFLGSKQSYAWLLTSRGLSSAVLPGRDVIEKQVVAYRKELAQHVSTLTAGASLARIDAQSREIYRTLLGHFDKELTGRTLIVVPDGILAYLPFETLSNGQSALIERFALSYAPSASALAALQTRRGRPKPSKAFLALADPEIGVRGRTAALTALAERGLDLVPLPSARTEVNAIRSLYKAGEARLYVGAEATEQALKGEDVANYRFLHFATHAYFDEQKPARSGIVLSAGSDPNQDGVLQVGEIMRLRLNADLVTLSACETGLGQVLAGEGVMGLSRAFLSAGAQSVVVSLWNVNDSATAELMKSFYGELSRGASREDALRKAKLSLIHGSQAAWRHPYYWAPFVMLGDRGN